MKETGFVSHGNSQTNGVRGEIALATVVCLAVLAVVSSCQRPGRILAETAPSSAVTAGDLIPLTLAGGFSLAGRLERYVPADLWKKIDGAADLFISYGFRELQAADFVRAGSKLPEIEVSVYNMGSDLNALGVYLQEKPEGAEKVGVGWEGYKSGEGLFFHKGFYYVKIIDLSNDSSLGAVSGEVARKIDGAINVQRQRVAEMEVFPAEAMVADSILYEHRDALGHGFLQRVFKANYTVGGKTATLFYCRNKDAEQLLAKYRDYGKEFGKVERQWQEGDLKLLSLSAFDKPELIFIRGDVLGGVLGCPDEPAGLKLIRALLVNIDRQSSRS
jgi:hypothetical protein